MQDFDDDAIGGNTDPNKTTATTIPAVIKANAPEASPGTTGAAMTKQQETESTPEHYELAWFPLETGVAPPAPLCRSVWVDRGRMAADPVYNADVSEALIVQFYEIKGPAFIASFLAERLRDPFPDRALLDMVASYLERQTNKPFRLEAVRSRDRRSLTKSINDIALERAVAEGRRALGNKHGDQKKVVKKVAEQYGVSIAKVQKAIRSK